MSYISFNSLLIFDEHKSVMFVSLPNKCRKDFFKYIFFVQYITGLSIVCLLVLNTEGKWLSRKGENESLEISWFKGFVVLSVFLCSLLTRIKSPKTNTMDIRTECIMLPGADISLRSGPRLPRHPPQTDQQAPSSWEEGEDQDSAPRTLPGDA